ncbi:hypothetical protein [Colwellia sp. E150_009]|jgi:hypothetical protein
MKIIHNIFVTIAILFGLVTIVAGTRILLGTNPGYIVFLPLLIYNAVMGIVYVVAGITAWRNIKQGMQMAAVIFLLNIVVLTIIFLMYKQGVAIAVDSLRAMSLRTFVWFVLFAGFWWIYRNNNVDYFKPNV